MSDTKFYWSSTKEALDYAIEQEQEAARFYAELAERAGNGMRKIFEGLVSEELSHKAKLELVKSGTIPRIIDQRVADLRISDYLVDVVPTPDMDYQDALIVAMKREKAAFRLYSDLAALSDDAPLRNTFLYLAQEEAKHKLRFELEYDDNILVEN